MSLLSPSQDLEQQTRDATSGVLRRPGRGKRAGQWVQSGGEFNNLTQDEVYGRLRARQGGNSGSGPGGGLRTGGLSQESGIDWLKANGPSRYGSGSDLRQAERNVALTGDASRMSKPDQAKFDKGEADKQAKAEADAKAAAVHPTTAPTMPDILNTPVGQTAKPGISPMIARPADPAAPAKPLGLAPPGAPNYQAPPVVATPAAPSVLAKPQVTTAAAPAPAPAPVNPDPLAPASRNPYPALARPQTAADPLAPTATAPRKPSTYGAMVQEGVGQHNPSAYGSVVSGAPPTKLAPRTYTGADVTTDSKGRESWSPESFGRGVVAPHLKGPGIPIRSAPTQHNLTPPPAANPLPLPVADPTASGPASASDLMPQKAPALTPVSRSKKSPLTTPSNPLDPVKVSQNPRTRGIPPVGGTPTPPVLAKPARPNNQAVVGNVANKRKKNPLSDMLKGLV